MHRIMAGLAFAAVRCRFLIAAFLIPLGIRAIPEIIVGPYPVGWDTIAFYIPNTLDWATGKVGLLQVFGTAPLMYLMTQAIYLPTRMSPVWIYKALGPLLYGAMILALYRFLVQLTGWTQKRAIAAALMTSLYFITLRIGWDLYRTVLGLTFVLLALTVLGRTSNVRQRVGLSAFILLAIASDQLTAILMAAILGVRILSKLRNNSWRGAAELIIVALPGMMLLTAMLYITWPLSGGSPIEPQPLVPGPGTIASSLGFLAFAYTPLLLPALYGIRRVASADLRTWSAFLGVSALTALLPLVGLNVPAYRFSLLLDIPLCIFAAGGLFGVTNFGWLNRSNLGGLHNKRMVSLSIAIIVMAILYIALPAQHAFTYYSAFPELVPTSMVQNTVPLSDMTSLNRLLEWVSNNMVPRAILITHQAIYGWARVYSPSLSSHLLNYGYSSPITGWEMAVALGYSSVFMIWWANGHGWDGQQYVPNGFVPRVSDGNLVVYSH